MNIEREDIVKALEVDAMEVMKTREILVSVMITKAIILLEATTVGKELIEANNPFALVAGKKYKGVTVEEDGVKYKSFDNMKKGLEAGLFMKGFATTKGVLDYEQALAKPNNCLSEDKDLAMELITAFKLDSLDDKVIDATIKSGSNIVDLEEITEQTEEVKKASNIESEPAVEVPVKKDDVIEVEIVEPKVVDKVEVGMKVFLDRANLYKNSFSTVPVRAITGEYYIVNARGVNNRFPIVFNKDYISDENYVIGYINKIDIKA